MEQRMTISEPDATKSILIVEDHPMVADAMRELLHKLDMTVRTVICHSAETGLDAFQGCSDWFRILLDIDVPGARGLSLVREFHQFGVARRCCVITGFDKPEWAMEVKHMGMLGYLVKAIPVEQFTDALETVLRGEPAFPETSAHQTENAVRLTRRQRDMLCLLQRGYSSKEIAKQLGLSEGTVNNHISGLLRALDVSNRAHAIAKGIELGCF